MHSHAVVHEGKLYIFVPSEPPTVPPTGGAVHNYSLKLYVADSPSAPWTEHPSSPLYTQPDWSSHAGGGAVLRHGGKLFRPVQDCRGWYGQCVRMFEITELSPTTFKEHLVTATPFVGACGSGDAAVGKWLGYCALKSVHPSVHPSVSVGADRRGLLACWLALLPSGFLWGRSYAHCLCLRQTILRQ